MDKLKNNMKKQLTIQQDKIDDIMDNFDFNKVETVMKATNWTWASTHGVPVEHELRKQARELLKSVSQHYVSELDFRYAISTGGFKATKYYDGELELEFIMAKWDTGD